MIVLLAFRQADKIPASALCIQEWPDIPDVAMQLREVCLGEHNLGTASQPSFVAGHGDDNISVCATLNFRSVPILFKSSIHYSAWTLPAAKCEERGNDCGANVEVTVTDTPSGIVCNLHEVSSHTLTLNDLLYVVQVQSCGARLFHSFHTFLRLLLSEGGFPPLDCLGHPACPLVVLVIGVIFAKVQPNEAKGRIEGIELRDPAIRATSKPL